MSTVYVNLSEINELQTNIMRFVDKWAREQRTPIPLKEILLGMKDQQIEEFTTIKAINVLLRKGYIRRAVMISNKSSFVQLRTV